MGFLLHSSQVDAKDQQDRGTLPLSTWLTISEISTLIKGVSLSPLADEEQIYDRALAEWEKDSTRFTSLGLV